MNKHISLPTLRRLPSYYHIICHALESAEQFISSAAIAKILNIDDTQVRKDIAATGYVGKPKFGFDTKEFKAHLEDYLGFNKTKEVFLVGAGNLGTALAKYDGFKKYGMEILALFDNDPRKVGLKVGGKEVFALSKLPNLVSRMKIKVVILAVPSEPAQEVADFLVKSGIKAIWNFAPVNLQVPVDVIVSNQDLGANFVTFSLMLKDKFKSS